MNARQQITSLCQQIVEKFKPQKVILFGSYAYGNPTRDSDIDLLVIMPFEGRSHRKAVEIRKGIESSFPLDLLVRTPEQVQERMEMEDYFMREVVEQGEVLYEENNN